ncbi:hypothetical protein BC937DRAFT_88558 [Endogone sp. FLAS-F59071]|nr:hypothetical protein BC937DRAFT_88558 [Endogone sp. FLAS-F59071]|eukprot:RUS18609.1 hypothetical protein BC937DRAFT_88558 [Endogone sp. FLAS-F59071]
MSHISKTEVVVAGIRLNVFGLEQWKLFHIHLALKYKQTFILWKGNASNLDTFCYQLADLNNKGETSHNHLIVISFDHVNHGTRLVNENANLTWADGNMTHAMDMWSIQYGTARDVSNLIDVLPAYLFPDEDASIVMKWGVCGISLGGHSAFLVLAAGK